MAGTVDPKAALAEIVSPQTLLDIEEYIKPQFPLRREIQEVGQQSFTNDISKQGTFSRRRIVMDGHGRWREVKPRSYSNINTYQNNSRRSSSSESNGALHWSGRLKDLKQGDSTGDVFLGTGDTGAKLKNIPKFQDTSEQQARDAFYKPEQRNSITTHPAADRIGSSKTYMYDHLSMAMRSNVFPGLGNNTWCSTSSRTYVEKNIVPPGKRSKFFGIQTDAFGQWSAANVHHEKMKKIWDDFLATKPQKPSGDWKPPDISQLQQKTDAPKPTAIPKKLTHKPKPKKNTAMQDTSTAQQGCEEVSAPTDKPPTVTEPADKPDDSFWDFYDKPFPS